MRRLIALGIVALAAIGGLVAYRAATPGTASTATNVTAWDADVNADGRINLLDLGASASYYGQAVPEGARPVAEQNLDTNGNIKVHEQGTVNVNVVSAPPTGPNLVLLGSFGPGVVPYPGSYDTSYMDVGGCKNFQIHIKGAPPVPKIMFNFTMSADGLTVDGLALSSESAFGGALGGSQIGHATFVTNYAAIKLSPGQGSTESFDQVSLYCERI